MFGYHTPTVQRWRGLLWVFAIVSLVLTVCLLEVIRVRQLENHKQQQQQQQDSSDDASGSEVSTRSSAEEPETQARPLRQKPARANKHPTAETHGEAEGEAEAEAEAPVAEEATVSTTTTTTTTHQPQLAKPLPSSGSSLAGEAGESEAAGSEGGQAEATAYADGEGGEAEPPRARPRQPAQGALTPEKDAPSAPHDDSAEAGEEGASPKLATNCPHDCNKNGRCEGGKCICFLGYKGAACETFMSFELGDLTGTSPRTSVSALSTAVEYASSYVAVFGRLVYGAAASVAKALVLPFRTLHSLQQ